MPLCPRCQATLAVDAVQCARCGLVLKAHGHPGIPLHRAAAGDSLCDRCTYHLDDSCTFPQRPYAQTCTLYQAIDGSSAERDAPPALPLGEKLRRWVSRRSAPLALLALIGMSFIWVLTR